jgi:hypothetical protein
METDCPRVCAFGVEAGIGSGGGCTAFTTDTDGFGDGAFVVFCGT